MSITSVRLADDIDKPLESLADKLDTSKSDLISQAVKEFLARQPLDESRWTDTLAALESIKSGKSFDEADVNAWLNSWGTDEHKEPPKW
ncbi:ribbon-helix-helix protein, CopG family [Thalassomonas viridans]|uniref:Ribbon-helix-helix protein, CopG family n=1 Tax=Thalassomonas viridans TaxID=137584 RepID=A0AAE9Z7R4_9GAMM|nr:ribbon-helix-helix protein, CopG family [Thalassomonas viridans]WDE06647.1 ribbon-helix-helix protein, CopG family [Thalassomonas viridans]